MSAAVKAVLSRPELLEAILIYLSMTDLLVHAQLVNKDFHSAITSFPSLRRKLFFSSIPVVGASSGEFTYHKDWELNPLLSNKFLPFFRQDSKSFRDFWSDIVSLRQMDWNSSKEKITTYKRREASWRRMLLTQPPITGLRIYMSIFNFGGSVQETGLLALDNGIKMGLLFDLVEMHMITKSPVCSFGLNWPILRDNNEGIALEPGEVKHQIELYMRYTVQCKIGAMGRGFLLRPKGHKAPFLEEWQFHSEGYKHINVGYQNTPKHIVGR
jgi:hypothetical protein